MTHYQPKTQIIKMPEKKYNLLVPQACNNHEIIMKNTYNELVLSLSCGLMSRSCHCLNTMCVGRTVAPTSGLASTILSGTVTLWPFREPSHHYSTS